MYDPKPQTNSHVIAPHQQNGACVHVYHVPASEMKSRTAKTFVEHLAKPPFLQDIAIPRAKAPCLASGRMLTCQNQRMLLTNGCAFLQKPAEAGLKGNPTGSRPFVVPFEVREAQWQLEIWWPRCHCSRPKDPNVPLQERALGGVLQHLSGDRKPQVPWKKRNMSRYVQ